MQHDAARSCRVGSGMRQKQTATLELEHLYLFTSWIGKLSLKFPRHLLYRPEITFVPLPRSLF